MAEEADRELSQSGFDDGILPGMANNALLEARASFGSHKGGKEGLHDTVSFGRHDELWGGSGTCLRLAGALAQRLRSTRSARATRRPRWRGKTSDEPDVGCGERARRVAPERSRSWRAARLRSTAYARPPMRWRGRLRGSSTRALTDYGAALRRANRRSDARDALQQGLDVARRCGAKPLAERARAELRIAGPDGAISTSRASRS